MAATQLPEHIVRRIEMMAMSPTPSCQAFKGALAEGLALPMPSLSMPGDEAYIVQCFREAGQYSSL